MITPSPGPGPVPVPVARAQAGPAPAPRPGHPRPPAQHAPWDAREALREVSQAELRGLTLRALRGLRHRALREESDLSYVRRLLQGRIDILDAECRRRAAPDGPVVDQLARILADQPSPPRASTRHLTLGAPGGSPHLRAAEEMLALVELSDLAARTDGELHTALARLTGYEQQVSRRRGALHRTADGCGAEIARRYREGEARVDDLLG